MKITKSMLGISAVTVLVSLNATVNAYAQQVVDDREFRMGREINPGDVGNQNSVTSPDLQMDTPQISGSGCPDGSASATLTPDQKTLSMLFSNFVVQSGSQIGAEPRSFKQCRVVIPFRVPAGMQLTVMRIDHRGFNSVPQGGATAYAVVYGLNDLNTNQPLSGQVRRRKTFQGKEEGEYTLTSLVRETPITSPCGKSIKLTIDTNAGASSNGAGEQTVATVDSMDVLGKRASTQQEQDFHLLWSRCDAGGNTGRPLPPGPRPPGRWFPPPPPPRGGSDRPDRGGVRCGLPGMRPCGFYR